MLKNGPGIVLARLVCQPGNGAKNVQKYPKAPLPPISILNLPKTNDYRPHRYLRVLFFQTQHTIATANAMTSGTSADLQQSLRGPPNHLPGEQSMGGTCQADRGPQSWPPGSQLTRIAAIPNAHRATLLNRHRRRNSTPLSPLLQVMSACSEPSGDQAMQCAASPALPRKALSSSATLNGARQCAQ